MSEDIKNNINAVGDNIGNPNLSNYKLDTVEQRILFQRTLNLVNTIKIKSTTRWEDSLEYTDDVVLLDDMKDELTLLQEILILFSKEYENQKHLESLKDIYKLSFNYDTQSIVIEEPEKDATYNIPFSLVDEGKIAQYNVVNVENEIDPLQDYIIPEAKDHASKILMNEDLYILKSTSDEYAFGYYGTNGFTTQESDISEFNNICNELISSFIKYEQSLN